MLGLFPVFQILFGLLIFFVFMQVLQTTSDEHKENQNKKTKKKYTTVNQLKMPKHTRSTFKKKNIDLDDA